MHLKFSLPACLLMLLTCPCALHTAPNDQLTLAEPRIIATHQGGKDPTTEGWTLHAAPGSSGIARGAALASDPVGSLPAWQIEKSKTVANSFYCYHADGLYDAAAATMAEKRGWRLVVKCRVVKSSGEHGQGFEIGTTRRRYTISFGRSKSGASDVVVHFFGGRPNVVNIPGLGEGYHTYELTSAPGTGVAFLTVDGKPVGGPFRGIPAGGHPNRLIFGNNASEAFGTVHYNKVQLEIAPRIDVWPKWDPPVAPARYVRTRAGKMPKPTVAVPNVCAWPNLTVLRDGGIVASIFNKPSHGLQEGDVECWVTRDGGDTWTKAGQPTQHNPHTVRMNVGAGLANNGDLLLLVSGWASADGGNTFRDRILPAWICRSSDGGRTWAVDKKTMPRTMPNGEVGVPFGDILPGADGALRAVIYGKGQQGDISYIYRSDDDGRTWGNPVLLDDRLPTNETALFHCGKGRWLAAARWNGLRLYISTDDAKTWRYQGPLTGGAQHPGHFTRLADGRILCTYGNRTGGDKGIDVRFSEDEGSTWSEPKRVADFAGDGGYPSSVQLKDGRVLTAFYASQTLEHAGYQMGVVRWDPASFVHPGTDAPVQARLLDVKKISGAAPHSAFTDLIRWRNQFYCAFRVGRGHVSSDGKIRLMTSSDGDDWVSTALIAKVDYDLRDADLAVTPDGRLMLLGGAAPRPRDGVSAPTGTFVCFSRDGVKWTEPQIVIEPGRWLWRTTWHEGKAYGFSYAAREGKGIDLLVSDDGIQWRPHARGLVTEGSPTEAQIRFDEDGRAIVLLRRDSGSAYLGLSAGDYTNWRWHDLDRSRQWGKPFEGGTAFGGFGGPNFAETLPGHWIAAGRMHEGGAHTALTYLDPEDQKMTKLLKLPSGGDTSYPGLVWHDGLLYVSYYSSHGGKTEIYLAKVQITERGARHNYVCRDGGAGGYEAFPDICRLVDDKLLCVFYAGLGHVTHPQANVPNGGRVMAATSTDEGRTWSQPWVVVDGPADDRDPSITRLKSGRLLCTYFTYPAGRVFMVHSDDQGVTWSAPRSIAPKSYYVSSPVRELSGTKSRLVLGLYRQDRGANGAVLLSDDEGQTWGAPIDIDNAGRVLDAETDVIELRDGSLYAAQRGASGTDMHWAVSRDRGQTWSKSESAGFQAHAPYLHRTVNGAIVLGHRRMVKGQLSRTAIRVSQDECKTWSEPFEADLGGGYSSMINLSDGSVLIVYYDDQGVGPKLAPGQHGQTVRRYSDIRARRFRVGTDGVQWLQPAGR